MCDLFLGTTGYIYAQDGQKDKGRLHIKDDIIKYFSGVLAPKLVGKPKIFIMQACQGSKLA